ncbi:MAG TPA: prepilin-type N-terminal cleavage/methylation domain-containing protein [Burkholderiales bacterium]|nr:prepilin-type N-terminal cleavage/methylation domain-containing protein [Burkholderiales bacterium]
MQLKRSSQGFSLVELAVVVAIMALLIGGAVMTLSAQLELRQHEETQQRLQSAAEAVLGHALVHRRLPCPARFTSDASHSQGQESFCTGATGTCAGSETTAVQAHGNCSNFYSGFLPAASIGASPVDSSGFAVDAWGNRIRYAVARDVTGCTTTPPANTRVFTSQNNLKTYGIGCRPNDLDVCTTASCAARAVSTETAVFLVFSTGKNGAVSSAYGADETENTNGNARFVMRTPSGPDSALGAFDDQVLVLPVGRVYSRLLGAGILP